MQASTIREKLHQFIDRIDDDKVEVAYSLLAGGIDEDTLRNRLIQAERAKYLNGEGTNFSWGEVKEMAAHKEQRSGL